MKTKRFYEKTASTAKKINLINRLGGKCSKCGETRHWLLEFHHKGDKEFGISSKKDRRFSVLVKEIDKCVCLCSNCHREEHVGKNKTKYSKLKMKMLEYKQTNCCQECGYSKLNNVLDFHHVNPEHKKFQLSKTGTQICQSENNELRQEIKDELEKCIVLCSNCHKTIHYDLQFFEDNKQYILEKSQTITEIQSALDKNTVKQMFESGIRCIDIAKHFKASKGTIAGIIKSFGLSANKVLDREFFKKLHSEGYTHKEIQKLMDVSESSVIKMAKELGVKGNKKKKLI